MNRFSAKPGMTLIEVLAVTAILAILLISSMFFIQPQISKGYDGRRKADLQKIATALEGYNNDKGGFPTEPEMALCGQANAVLKNYMRGGVPCDARTKQPYVYVGANCSGTTCRNYRLYTILENEMDPDIERVCGTNKLCVMGTDFNYGVGGGVLAEQYPP